MQTIRVSWPARAAIAALVMVVAAGFGACADETTVNTSPADTSGITVTGHGEVQIPPDIGFVTIGIQSTAATVADARGQAAAAANAVIDAIKDDGVDEDDIQTVGLSISAVYDYTKTNESPKIVGYTVSNTVVTKVRELESMSAVIDDAVAAGGDDSRLQGISFGIDDETEAKEEAREAAMADARAKAEQLARLGGLALGAPVTISEERTTVSQGARDAEGSAAGVDIPTPIETGTNTVTVEVSVRFLLQ